MKNNKGFTLVELLAVIVIMGILMMVAIPAVTRTIENSRKDTFVDIAKSYGNAARTLWTSDNLNCDGTTSSAVDDGNYYILINSRTTAKDRVPVLVDQGGKSSWGNRDVNGYVRVNVSTTKGIDGDNDGTYEVEPRRVTTFYVALSDGTHGLIDDDTLVMDKLKRGNVNMNLTTSDLKKVEFTENDGKLNCTKTSLGTYMCEDIEPITNISGICTDDKSNTETLDFITLNPATFATDDWTTVIEGLRSGTHPYSIGDTKTVDIGSFGTHTIRLSNLTSCDGSLQSKSGCGVVLEFTDVIIAKSMNSPNSNVGGWPATKLRKYLNNDIYNALPEELKQGILNTTVISGHGATEGEENFTSIDKLYLLSPAEIWSQGVPYDTAQNSTRQLDYYKNLGVRHGVNTYTKKQQNGTNSWWWLRTGYSNFTAFDSVSPDGALIGHASAHTWGISPVFKVA